MLFYRRIRENCGNEMKFSRNVKSTSVMCLCQLYAVGTYWNRRGRKNNVPHAIVILENVIIYRQPSPSNGQYIANYFVWRTRTRTYIIIVIKTQEACLVELDIKLIWKKELSKCLRIITIFSIRLLGAIIILCSTGRAVINGQRTS